MKGGPGTSLKFGNILREAFTICSITRYTANNGGLQKKILRGAMEGSNDQWTQGHHSGKPGLAHYTQWNTVQEEGRPNTNRVNMCGQNGWPYIFTANGRNVVPDGVEVPPGLVSPDTLEINTRDGDESHFGVMEVATWDRALSDVEMGVVSDYMADILENGQGVSAMRQGWDAEVGWQRALTVAYSADSSRSVERECAWDASNSNNCELSVEGSRGDPLVLVGAGFAEQGNVVTVGGAPCPVTSESSGLVKCTLPEIAGGHHVVQLTKPQVGTAIMDMHSGGVPKIASAVTNVWPDSRSLYGGQEIVLSGHGFAPSAERGAENRCDIDFDVVSSTNTEIRAITRRRMTSSHAELAFGRPWPVVQHRGRHIPRGHVIAVDDRGSFTLPPILVSGLSGRKLASKGGSNKLKQLACGETELACALYFQNIGGGNQISKLLNHVKYKSFMRTNEMDASDVMVKASSSGWPLNNGEKVFRTTTNRGNNYGTSR